MTSVEQQARDLLDRMEIDGAQNFSSGELVELANLISERNQLDKENRRIRDREVLLAGWLEEILHVHFYDMQEWETVQKWLDDPKTFEILGEPFKSGLEPLKIISQQQLDDLPSLSIVQDPEGAAWTKDTEHNLSDLYGPWFVCGFEVPAPTVDMPARLLYKPEEPQP